MYLYIRAHICIYVCVYIYVYTQHISFTRVTQLIHTYVVTPPYNPSPQQIHIYMYLCVCVHIRVYIPYIIYLCDTTHSYVCRDSSIQPESATK